MSQSADQLRTSSAPNCRRYASVADYILATEPRFGRNGPDKARTIYFIGTADGPVKIGLTSNVQQRLESLQTGSPVKLEVLATREGDAWLERCYHRFFAHCRLRGEWFDRSDNLLAQEIRHLRRARARPRRKSAEAFGQQGPELFPESRSGGVL